MSSRPNSSISNLYRRSPRNLSKQYLEKAKEYSRKIFVENSNENIFCCLNAIKTENGVFDKLIKTVDASNRLIYCKTIFAYCEMSQDWRVVGIWLKEEINMLDIGNEELPWLYFAYGRYLEEVGKIKQSRYFHEKGFKISQERNDLAGEALNKFGLGVTLQRHDHVKDIKKSVPYLVEAAKFFEKNNMYQEANILMSLGSCYDRLGYSDQAISAYQKCILILCKIKNSFDLGRAYYSLGIAYINNNKLGLAQLSFEQGEEHCLKSQNLYFISHIKYGKAWLEYCNKNLEKSRSLIEDSISTFNKYKVFFLGSVQLSFYESEGNIYLLAGAIYCKLNPINQDRIIHYLKKAELAYEQLEYNDKKMANVLANRARLYEYLKDWEKSIELFLILLDRGKQMNSSSVISDASIHLIYIYWQKKSSFMEWISIIRRFGYKNFIYLIIRLLKRFFTVF